MKKNSIIFRVLLLIQIVILTTSSIAQPLYAFGGRYDPEFFGSNDIILYNPEDSGCIGSGQFPNSSGSAANSIEDTESNKHIFQALINGGMNAVQAAAVMGNMWHESRFNSDAHEVGNDIGYGLVQWSFGRRTNLEAFAKEKGVATSDVDMQLEFLFKEYNDGYKNKLDGSDFDKSEDVSKATESWMMKFEIPKMAPANDPAALNSDRIPAAIKLYEYYKDLSPADGSVAIKPSVKSISTINCGSGNGAVAGNIIGTALNFALQSPAPNGTTAESDARDTYRAAKPTINPSADWTDCGGFVATVMRASGVDPDYPLLGVHPNQEPYVRNNPDKYLIIENVNGSGDLQPGDILMTEGHTVIYTGMSDYPAVDASLGERVPSVQTSGNVSWMIDNNTIAARIIK